MIGVVCAVILLRNCVAHDGLPVHLGRRLGLVSLSRRASTSILPSNMNAVGKVRESASFEHVECYLKHKFAPACTGREAILLSISWSCILQSRCPLGFIENVLGVSRRPFQGGSESRTYLLSSVSSPLDRRACHCPFGSYYKDLCNGSGLKGSCCKMAPPAPRPFLSAPFLFPIRCTPDPGSTPRPTTARYLAVCLLVDAGWPPSGPPLSSRGA